MVAFGILSIRLMFNRILHQDVLKELILFSMSLEMTYDSQPYRNTVTLAVSKSFTLLEISHEIWLFQRCSNFQNVFQARALKFSNLRINERAMQNRTKYTREGAIH